MENKEHKFELDEKEYQEFSKRLKESRFEVTVPERKIEVFIFDYKDYLKSKKGRLKLTVTKSEKFLSYKKLDGEGYLKESYEVKIEGPVEEIIKEMGYCLVSSCEKKETVWESGKDKIIIQAYPFTVMVKAETGDIKKLKKELNLDEKKLLYLEIDDIFNDRFGYEKKIRFE